MRQWVTANPLRPVIWADEDPLIRRCRKWLHRLQPHSSIVNPEKAVGITPADIEAIDQFLRGSASIKGQVRLGGRRLICLRSLPGRRVEQIAQR